MRTILAVLAAKAARLASHMAGRQGSALPGRIALKADPGFIRNLAGQVRGKIIVTCGTNGKTTTNNLLCSMLEAQGYKVVCNRAGANMIEGVAAAFADAAGVSGRLDADYACLEIDEASAHYVFEYLTPDIMIVTNLFRDQLDRYGEIDLTMEALERAIRMAPDMKLIINGDDPLTAWLAMKSGNGFECFGVSERVPSVEREGGSGEIREGRFCERCGAPLHYDFYHFSQLGVYHCPSCGFKRPEIAYDASNVRPAGGASGGLTCEIEGYPVESHMTGFYNVYNLLAVWAALKECGLDTGRFNEVLRGYRPQFGRGEVFEIDGKRVLLNLAKNPAGFNQNISAMLEDRSPKDLIIVINDNAQDGRDISWLWDVDYDRLADETVQSITVSGTRALDMRLRLKYVGIGAEVARLANGADNGPASVGGSAPDAVENPAAATEAAIEEKLAGGCGNLYVLVNYTALYAAHEYLKKREK